MIRTLLILLAIMTAVAVGIGVLHDSGTASVTWLHYRIDTSASAAVIIIGVLAFLAVAFWNLALWISRAPQRAERARADARRRHGEEAVTRGFMAIANGDGTEARRQSVKALDQSDNIVLVRILSALAAEESGDATAARSAYSAMLSVPELRLAGLKGLVQLADKAGDTAETVRLATEAYNLPRPTMWAFETLFEAKLSAGEWGQALDLIDGALNRKLISPIFSERAKASLMAATAAQLETAPDAQTRDQAMDYALRAAKLQPQFTPAPVIASRQLLAAGKLGRAEDILESGWGAQPHPAIWLAYRDLVGGETPRERARRLQGLIDRNPRHRESRLLQLERALLINARADIIAAVAALEDDAADDVLTRRLCGLLARASQALGDHDAARTWTARAALARAEPDWSDLDAEGRAFNYGASDWSSLILTYARTATLIHPRFERGEKGLPDMPDLPARYVPSMPFIKAANKRTAPLPQPDDPGIYDDASTGQDLDEVEVKVKSARKVRAAPKAK